VIFIVSNTFWSPPGIHMLNYVASKGALIGMARTLAVGLGSDGIAVTAVAPGLTRTPATVVVPAAEFADAEAHQSLPRPLTPDDTAAVVAMLVRGEAALPAWIGHPHVRPTSNNRKAPRSGACVPVGDTGLEPVTSALSRRRSPS
jgi:NAD(P)-dependent dehydrogenase (short-subunit alcohol dehydrogenase family)